MDEDFHFGAGMVDVVHSDVKLDLASTFLYFIYELVVWINSKSGFTK